MADFTGMCLFAGVSMDTCLEDTLADDDFLKFLQDTDLTGALPIIPDVYQATAAADIPDASGNAASGSPVPGHLMAVVTTHSPIMASVTGLYPVSVGHPVQALPSEVAVSAEAILRPPLLPVLRQAPPQKAGSSSSSDISAAAAGLVSVSAPGSPVSSDPTCSSDTSGHHAVDKQQRCSGTSRQHSQRLSSSGTAAASQQSQQLQPQKLLTKQQLAANKRRAPEVDWRSIEDPAERRRQRRLAKNRVTAARSRERKKEQMADMEDRMAVLEQENSQMRALLASLAQENTSLKEQLASLTRGASTANNTRNSPEPAVLKCLAIMHLVCCLLVVKASFWLVRCLVSAAAQQVAWSAMSSAATCSSLCIAASASGSVSCCVRSGCHGKVVGREGGPG